jgi:adenine C2-methylase RlmN of 23S rRNA A2503 and tRNA A37
MISIIYNTKVKNIAGINTEISDSKSFTDSSELLSYCFHNDIPNCIDLIYNNEKEEQEYKKLKNTIIEFCDNLKIRKPLICIRKSYE